MCVQGLSASYQGDWYEGTGCQLLGSDWGWCPTPGLWCQLLEPVGSQRQLLELVGVFNLQPLEREECVSQKRATRGMGPSEVRGSALAAGPGPRVTARVPAAGDECLYLPQPGVRGVCLWIRWQTPSWTSWGVGDLGSGQRY